MQLFYNGSEEEARANFKPFFDLGKSVGFQLVRLSVKSFLLIEHIAEPSKEIPYELLNASEVAMVSIPLIH